MKTIAPITVSTGDIRPEFVPVPKPGARCPYTGLSRSYICALIASGEIESVSLRKQGRTRGKRLIVYKSLSDFINAAREPGKASK